MELSRETLKRIENIKKICSFDMKNRIATVNIYYKSIDDVVDYKLGYSKNIVVNSDSIVKLQRSLELIPIEFDVDFNIIIDDYKGVDVSLLKEAYYTAIKSFKFKKKEKKKFKNKLMNSFLLFAIIPLILIAFTNKYKYFDFTGPVFSAAILYFFYLLFETFVEESTYILSINRIYDYFSNRNTKRVHNIYFKL